MFTACSICNCGRVYLQGTFEKMWKNKLIKKPKSYHLSRILKSSILSSSLKGKCSESLSENAFGRMPKSSLSDSALLGGSGMWSRDWTDVGGTGDPGVQNGDAVWTGDTGAGWTGDTGV